MNRGDILLSPKHEQFDGYVRGKYLIVLNPSLPNTDAPFLGVVATKQRWGRVNKQGCYTPDGYFFLDANYDWFPEPTWILFFRGMLVEFSPDKVISEEQKGNLRPRGSLREATVREILRCMKNSFDISRFQKETLGIYTP